MTDRCSTSIRLNSWTYYECPANWAFNPLPFADYDLWLITSGHGYVEVDGRRFDVKAGDCFIFQPGMQPIGRHKPEHPLKVYVVHYDYSDGDTSRCSPASVPPLYRHIADFSFIETVLLRSGAFSNGEDCDKASFWFLAALRYIDELDQSTAQAEQQSFHAEGINSICNMVLKAPYKSYTLSDLSRRLSISPDHFTRVFKRLKGVTPMQFMARARVEYAKSLLQMSNVTVAEVAVQAGYSDVYYFSKCFKRITGVPPSRFRTVSFGP